MPKFTGEKFYIDYEQWRCTAQRTDDPNIVFLQFMHPAPGSNMEKYLQNGHAMNKPTNGFVELSKIDYVVVD